MEPTLLEIAAAAAGVQPAEVMACGLRLDGSLAVVVWPGPKTVYPADVVSEITTRLAKNVTTLPKRGAFGEDAISKKVKQRKGR